jgi:hypothetical protein
VFAVALVVAALTSIVFGILPAVRLSKSDHVPALGARGGSAGRGESRIRAALTVAQLTMATVLLVGAGLLMHSFVKLSSVNNGYDPSNVLAFNLLFPNAERFLSGGAAGCGWDVTRRSSPRRWTKNVLNEIATQAPRYGD